MNSVLTRPALRYYGGKWRIAPWIISHFPEHICYVEPYAGGGSVILRKPPAVNEVLNDIDGDVIAFFDVLRRRPEELISSIQLTPFARSEVERAYEPCADEIERARRFYVKAWQARGGPRAQWRTGWRFQKNDSRGKRSIDDWNETSHLWTIVYRLKQIQIECDDAITIIKRYDSQHTLFYLDPPYPAGVRGKRWSSKAYAYEMSDDDHRALSQVLHKITGMAIISGYDCELYRELYADWTFDRKMTIKDTGKKAYEYLWLSPSVIDRHIQKKLF